MISERHRRRNLLILLHLRRKYRKRERQYWVHPILAVRYLEGNFYTLFEKLRCDDAKFFNYFRMSTSTFDFLEGQIGDLIKGQDTPMRVSIPPKEMLAVTIRYLATGATFTEMHYNYRLGISTVRKIVRLVCNALWDTLKHDVFPKSTEENWRAISDQFATFSHFPNCLGAVDGKHIRVNKFPHSGSMNLNYKSYFSIVLMAIADCDYKFTYVDIGAYGKDCDSSVFQETSFFKLLMQNKLNIPASGPLNTHSNLTFPFVFVGDEAFSLSENMMRPYAGHYLPENKRVFNYRLSRARRYVECAFGIFANKWRIFHKALNVSKDFAKDIVKACVVLHNLVRSKDGYRSADTDFVQRLHDINTAPCCRSTRNANDIRDRFTEYFVSAEGALPWQNAKI
ncbi:hypothetical protein PPYR_01833 [Photinus pyralis]|uniref:DDE Tnp4 domain-containing protein n=1 Tax=Photinus pyralis TaxID=7054 RepID=A0A5N4B5N8_PHOPY|nr:protein ALP1-like [Photinus pyralis]KAB0804863.1 hypothetical protein PPYR_01833 [Photinus pyralis]